jgi:hypothetical protein
MKNIIEEITKLTNEWYILIGPDHHKDRDCHWYIETKWSYGKQPVYIICHSGYIIDEIEETWSEYELALIRLKDILKKEIEEYRSCQKENEENGW